MHKNHKLKSSFEPLTFRSKQMWFRRINHLSHLNILDWRWFDSLYWHTSARHEQVYHGLSFERKWSCCVVFIYLLMIILTVLGKKGFFICHAIWELHTYNRKWRKVAPLKTATRYNPLESKAEENQYQNWTNLPVWSSKMTWYKQNHPFFLKDPYRILYKVNIVFFFITVILCSTIAFCNRMDWFVHQKGTIIVIIVFENFLQEFDLLDTEECFLDKIPLSLIKYGRTTFLQKTLSQFLYF